MSNSANTEQNIYLFEPIPGLFLRTAAPIILIMLVNGLHTIVDTYFLGAYVGAQAVTAVTLMFPFYMMLVALSTLVSNGFSSIYARLLGADEHTHAREVMKSAFQLALSACLVLMGGYFLGSGAIALWIANGSQVLADLGQEYMSILIYFSPIMFILAINVDALRGEGLLPAMVAFTLTSALLNIAFDWIFVGLLGFGVMGSALGTVVAQALSLTGIFVFRLRRREWINPIGGKLVTRHWPNLLALGAPTSLGYVGLALSAGVTLFALRIWAQDSFAATSGAFGISTRLMTFVYLPLLGLSMAFQTILGNNYGAGRQDRVRTSVLTAIGLALIYCIVTQAAFAFSAPHLGGLFVDDVAMQREVAQILPIVTMTLFLFGPMMMIAVFYQAIGDAKRAAILQLSRTYLLGIPLTLMLPLLVGKIGIWYSGVVAEAIILALTLHVVSQEGLLSRLIRQRRSL